MTNLEKYKDEISLNGINRNFGCMIHRLRRGNDCKIDNCRECNRNSLDWLSEEYKEPKIKLTKMEYDVLHAHGCGCEYHFSAFVDLSILKEKGYFKGINDREMSIKNILANCEVTE